MKKQIYLTMLATLGGVSIPTIASAATFQTTTLTDTDFSNLVSSGQFIELFVAEARIGNNGLSGDREFGINNDDGSPVAQGQRTYKSGDLVPFTLEYTGTTVNYTLGSQTLNSSFDGRVDTIYFRNRTQGSASISLSNISIDDVSGAGFTTSGNDVDYAVISDISEPFTLSGNLAFSDFESLRGSQVASQIKVGAVPEPLTILGAGTALGFGVLFKRKTSQRQQDKS